MAAMAVVQLGLAMSLSSGPIAARLISGTTSGMLSWYRKAELLSMTTVLPPLVSFSAHSREKLPDTARKM